MALDNLDLIQVTGTWVLANGEVGEGSVTFEPNVILIDKVTNEIVLPVAFTVELVNGSISVALPATDDPDLENGGVPGAPWAYKVTEKIAGTASKARKNRKEYPLELPHDGGPVDLSDKTEGVPPEPIVNYVTLADFNTKGVQYDIDNDVTLPASVISGGTAAGGVFRRAQHLYLPWTYTQTEQPTDPAIGTAVLVDWNATLNDPTPFGPRAQTGYFGPRGVFEIEGILRYGQNTSRVVLAPVGYADILAVGNTAGDNRGITPGWSYMSTRVYFADGATVTHQRNDTDKGAAQFIDNTVYLTVQGGTWDGADNAHIGFLSHPFVLAGVTLDERIAYKVQDASFQDPDGAGVHPDESAQIVADIIGLGTATPGLGTINTQVGFDVRRLTVGTRNVGFRNASTTVNVPQTVADADLGVTLPLLAGIVDIEPASDRTLSVTPAVPAGLDGQSLVIRNRGAGLVTFRSEQDNPGSLLRLATPTRRLAPNDVLSLTWSDEQGAWTEDGASRLTGDSAPFASRTHSGAQSIPNATWTTVQFDTSNAAVHGEHWDGTLHRFVPEFYDVVQLSAAVTWAANGTGRRKLRIRTNLPGFAVLPARTVDTAASGESHQPQDTGAVLTRVQHQHPLTDQWLDVQVFQDSGGALDITKEGIQTPLFGAVYFRPY